MVMSYGEWNEQVPIIHVLLCNINSMDDGAEDLWLINGNWQDEKGAKKYLGRQSTALIYFR